MGAQVLDGDDAADVDLVYINLIGLDDFAIAQETNRDAAGSSAPSFLLDEQSPHKSDLTLPQQDASKSTHASWQSVRNRGNRRQQNPQSLNTLSF
jgi:hypothetical protein